MKFLIFGDFLYDLDEVPGDIEDIGKRAKEEGAVLILNLEGPLTDRRTGGIWKRGNNLKQTGSYMEALKTLGTSGVTLANNHMMDFGDGGLSDTLKELDEAGILHAGAGRNMAEALKPMIFREGDETTAIFNFGWGAEETVCAEDDKAGCAPRDNEIIIDTVLKYSDINPDHKVIVILHWGFELNLYPMPYDIDLAHRLTKIRNVCAVVGHHPHCPQPVEIFDSKPVFYSLGNFYFGSRRLKYSKKKYDHTPENMSDYGIGALIDVSNGASRSMVLRYDKDLDRTVFADEGLLPEKMPDMDLFSREYVRLVKKTALEKNPVLGTGRLKNFISVFIYNTKRNIMKLLVRS